MPKQSLSLKTYLALARPRGGTAAQVPRPPRPKGALLWAHADSLERARALASLCARIVQHRHGVNMLMTGQAEVARLTDTLAGTTAEVQGAPLAITLADTLPPDTLPEVSGFIDHWSPDLCLWSGQNLYPALLHVAANAGCRLALVGATDRPWTTPAVRWLPDTAPTALRHFDVIYTEDDAAERRLRRMGVAERRLRRTGPLTEARLPLDCSPRLHTEMSEQLAGRPVWLAARVRAGEVAQILRAHKRASRLAHRLLLILVPALRDEAARISQEAAGSGFRLCRWDEAETPDENAQILLASGPEDLGLWYRLAPLAFIGGSLVSRHGGHDPFEAAALGSAVLYGPNVGRHLPAYSRLAEAGAARIVRDVDTLSAAVSQLIAPDQAAAMAHAGWDVVSAGAEMTDRVVEQSLQWLDQAGAA